MATDLARLGFAVDSDGVATATRRLDRMEGSSRKAETASERLAKRTEAMQRTIMRAGVVAGAAIAGITANSLRLAVAAEETANKFAVVFRGSVEASDRKLQELSKTIPLTVTEMRGMAAGIQDMLVPMGLARSEAAGMSTDMIQLAGDLGSFNNVGTDQVLEAIKSALAGSSEPMRRYGVDTRETRLQTLALNEGLIQHGQELDNSSRAQAVFLAIQRDSTDAMGDAARTVNSTANQMRFMKRNLTQVQEELGNALLPAFNDFISALNDSESGMSTLEATARGFGVFIARLSQGLLLLGAGIQTVLSYIDRLAQGISTITQFGVGVTQIGAGAAAAAAEWSAAGEQADRELQESRDRLFKTVAGLEEAIAKLKVGATDTLKENEKLASSAGAVAEATDEATGGITKQSKALKDYNTLIGDLYDELKPLAAAQLELEENVKTVYDAFEQGEISADDFAEAMRLLTQSYADFVFETNGGRDVDQLRRDFYSLEQQLDPTAAAIRQMEAAQVVLNAAVDAGIISEERRQELLEDLPSLLQDATEASGSWQDALSRGVERLDDLFADLWKGFFDKSVDAMDAVKDWFKGLLAEMAHAAITRPIAVHFSKAFSEGGQFGSLGNVFGGYFNQGGASAGTSGAAGGTDALGAGAGAASWLPIVGWILAGMAINNELFNQGWSVNNGGMDTASYNLAMHWPDATTAIIADKILTSIGISDKWAAILSGSALFSRAFGHKSPEVSSMGIRGSYGFDGIVGEQYAGMLAKGGWFRSDKRWEETTGLDDELVEYFTSILDDVESYVKQFANVAGIDLQELLDTLSFGFDIELDEDPAIAEKQLQDLADDMVKTLLGAVAEEFGVGVKSFLAETADVDEQLKRLAIAANTAKIIGEIETLSEYSFNHFRAVAEAIAEETGGNLTDSFESLLAQVTTVIALTESLKTYADSDPAADLQGFLDAQNRSLFENAALLREELSGALDGFDGSMEGLQNIAALTAQTREAELQMLLQIQAVSQDVQARLGGLREMIVTDLSTDPENYARYRTEAEELAASLETMTDPAMIQQTVARIEQLTRSAYGLLDEEQRAAMGQGFLDFIDDVQATALERLGLAEESVLAQADADRARIAEFIEGISDPLLLVAEMHGLAADELLAAAEALGAAVGGGDGVYPGDGVRPGDPPSEYPSIPNSRGASSEQLETAVKSGMEAGAQAMVQAATNLATATITASDKDSDSAAAIARAIASLPGRIEVRIVHSEFN